MSASPPGGIAVRGLIRIGQPPGAPLPPSDPAISTSSGSMFHRNAEPLYLVVSSQFQADNRFALFRELL